MKKLLYLLFAVCAFSAVDVKAQDLITQYNTYISGNDIENSDGERLSGVADIIRQDRANVYKFGNPDSDPTEDGSDDFFASQSRRAMIDGMIQNGPGVAGALKKAILRGDAYITVSVYRTGSGRYFIEIEPNNA